MAATTTVNWSDHQQATKKTNNSQVGGSLRVGEAARTVIDNFRVLLRLTADCRQLVCHVARAMNFEWTRWNGVEREGESIYFHYLSSHLIDHLHLGERDGLGVAEIPQLPGAIKQSGKKGGSDLRVAISQKFDASASDSGAGGRTADIFTSWQRVI